MNPNLQSVAFPSWKQAGQVATLNEIQSFPRGRFPPDGNAGHHIKAKASADNVDELLQRQGPVHAASVDHTPD